MMIALEGPDMCGKTQIGNELAKRMGLAYYKNSEEWSTDLRSADYFKNVLTYGATIQTDLMCQVKPRVVLDRYYPSEWVYSKVFDRESNPLILEKIDKMFSDAGGKIVICRRKSYEGIADDLHSYVGPELLRRLDEMYAAFSDWTKCAVMTLWVDDENLDRQVQDIAVWLEGCK